MSVWLVRYGSLKKNGGVARFEVRDHLNKEKESTGHRSWPDAVDRGTSLPVSASS